MFLFWFLIPSLLPWRTSAQAMMSFPIASTFPIGGFSKHVLLPAFDPAAPLQGAPQYGFSLEYERKGEGKFQFSTIDNSHQTPDGVPFRISFGAKLGLSPLVKRTTIQNLSSTQPTPYDFEINSPDN